MTEISAFLIPNDPKRFWSFLYHRQHEQSQYTEHVFSICFRLWGYGAARWVHCLDTKLSFTQHSVVRLLVATALRNLDPKKACGLDRIPVRLLKEVASEITPSLYCLFNLSLSLGAVSASWKLANVTPVFKKDDPSLSTNYRPISLLSTLSKVLERCVFNHCYSHFTPFLYNLQHGFQKGKATITQLLQVYHNILNSLASGKETDV